MPIKSITLINIYLLRSFDNSLFFIDYLSCNFFNLIDKWFQVELELSTNRTAHLATQYDADIFLGIETKIRRRCLDELNESTRHLFWRKSSFFLSCMSLKTWFLASSSKIPFPDPSIDRFHSVPRAFLFARMSLKSTILSVVLAMRCDLRVSCASICPQCASLWSLRDGIWSSCLCVLCPRVLPVSSGVLHSNVSFLAG